MFAQIRTVCRMCRSIKVLRTPAGPASEQEIVEAARQFVRKVSGMREPAAANSAPFEAAIAEISASSRRLLAALPARRTMSSPRPRPHRTQ